MMKRLMLMLVALMFVFCTSAMAAENDIAPADDTKKVEEKQDTEKQDSEKNEAGGEAVELR